MRHPVRGSHVGVLALILAVPGLLLLPTPTPGRTGEDPKPTLTNTARVGTVASRQGAPVVRPAGRRRWSPLRTDDVLLPGDLLKTPTRGAHALEVSLRAGGYLVLGPGALVELPAAGTARVLRGEVEIRGADETPVLVETPGRERASVKGTAWLRVERGETRELDRAPRWLQGYRDSVGEEWMGSLLAQVDGRDVPLSVGYHKVTADVRDRIARTTVEQSFVNSTDQRLEGVFYFPLPADASISGFGMWIGGELVEADIVEKARARQIYEDILRRKKDPGLLEWQGGNLFKARVFPIEPRSEKRIRIRYTQVLRLEGATFRYRYALRSDLLRSKPLRRLDLQVNVLSERGIEKVECPSHATRVTSTGHEARVEFDAEEYVPDRDFEVAVTLQAGQGLAGIAHRRGNDGYFMLLLAPPEAEGAGWQRELTPESEALDVRIVADTSGSMDAAARGVQSAFVEAFLGLLGEDDRFQLYAVDADVRPSFDAPRSPSDENVASALAFLGHRASLGWSDLDLALARALEGAGERTVVVYVGDGIPTTGDANPEAQADRLRALRGRTPGAVHAVATKSTYEQGVLDAMAEIGGGSARRADGDPAKAAYALLAEVARPAIRDLRIRVEGLRTARVVPETLPNLPLGTEQVVLGRYLPLGGDEGAAPHEVTVVVTGELDGEKVSLRAPLTLPATDAGNSFLPRLWARKYLDVLLQQGASAEVKEEIVGFSRELAIMTPYTSFLVLESDEDRERYGVTRTVKMRDGESYFAEGRDRVALEMARKASREARTWRTDLRRRMVKEIAGLGRDFVPPGTVKQVAWAWMVERRHDVSGFGYTSFDVNGNGRTDREELTSYAGRAGGRARGGVAVERARSELRSPESKGKKARGSWDAGGDIVDSEVPAGERAPAPEELVSDMDFVPESELAEEEDKRMGEPPARRRSKRPSATPTPVFADEARLGYLFETAHGTARGGTRRLASEDLFFGAAVGAPFPVPPHQPELGFPILPPPGRERPKRPDPDWEPAALEALRALDRRPAFAALAGGLRIVQEGRRLHPVRQATESVRRDMALISGTRWFTRAEPETVEPVAAWLDGERRAAVLEGRRQGRRRAAVETDRRTWTFPLRDLSLDDLVDLFRRRDVSIAARDGDVVDVRVEPRELEGTGRVLRVDLKRRVLLEDLRVLGDLVLGRIVYGGFVEAGGLWWATTIEIRDRKDRVVDRAQRTVESLEPEAFDRAFGAALQPYGEDVLWLEGDLPKVKDAKQAAAEERATFADRIALVLHAMASQQWADARKDWEAAKDLAGEAPGLAFAETTLLRLARDGEALERHLEALATGPLNRTGPAAVWHATWILGRAAALGPHERLVLLRQLDPRFESGGPRAVRDALRRRAGLLAEAGDPQGARDVRALIARSYPHDVSALRPFVDDLRALGRIDDAEGALRSVLDEAREKPPTYTDAELAGLYGQWMDLLWNARDLDGLDEVASRWTGSTPSHSDAWWRAWSLRYLEGDVAGADALVLEHLGSPTPDDPLGAPFARLGAAVRLALGEGWQFNAQRVEPAFVEPLVDLGHRLAAAQPEVANLASTIRQSRRFRQTDGVRRLLEAWRGDLLAAGALASLPVRRIVRTARWLPWDANQVDPDVFQTVAAGLAARREATNDRRERRALGDLLVLLHDQRGDRPAAADVVATLREEAKGLERYERTLDLFDRLLALEGGAERAERLAALLPDLLDPYAPQRHERIAATASRRFAKWLFDVRKKVRLGPPEERRERTRAEARDIAKRAAQAARADVAATLSTLRAALGAPFAPWLEIERLGYLVERGEGLPEIEAAARELLGTLPPAPKSPSLASLLAERCVLVLDYASTRRNAPDGLADRTLALFEAREKAPLDKLLGWRFERFRLLVALDRVEAIEEALRSWIRPADVQSGWRITLGYVLAETGRLAEAASLFETVAERDELSSSEWASLASWYLVLGSDAPRERALEGRYAAMSEQQLSNLLYRVGSRVSRRGADVPDDLDPETLRAMRALLRKASHPESYVWQIRRIYRAVKDHRLIESLAAGLPGHTPEGVYPFLARLGEITREVHEEATLDRALAVLREVAATAKTPVDVRALRLYEAVLEGRAALVPDPEPGHAARAIEALGSAFEGPWVPGERRHVARVLASMGAVPDAKLAEEQLRGLRALRDATKEASPDRLEIAHALARTLKAYKRPGDAVTVLGEALQVVRRVDGPALPPRADGAFRDLVNLLVAQGHYREAETELLEAIDLRELVARRTPVEQRLLHLHAQAVQTGATTRLGQGSALITEATKRIDAYLEEGPPNSVRATVQAMSALYQAAARKRVVPDAGRRFETWADGRLPRVFPRLVLQQTNLVETAAEGIEKMISPRAAIRYVLDRRDAEPAFLERLGDDLWTETHWNLARWRRKAGALGDLEPRLLEPVLASLESYLRGGRRTGQGFWRRGDNRFWAEKADAFAATAGKVVELAPHDPTIQYAAASYLRKGLGRNREAVAVLLSARDRDVLTEPARLDLARWLVADDRFADALPVTEELMELRPEVLEVRLLRSESLHGVERGAEALTLLEAAAKRWREKEQWTSGVALALGERALEQGEAAAAEPWLAEAARLRVEARRGRSGADGTLSRVYGLLARARVMLGETDAAVDAASAAVVAWGRTHKNRRQALDALERVLRSAPDLPAFVERYEDRVAETGLDAPILRKALAAVYEKKAEHAKAVHHLRAARELAPEDAEVHQRLVAAYDALGEQGNALDALMESLGMAPRNLDAAADLARRFQAAGRVAEAERARTNLVEPLPHEADGHRRLAAVREEQERLPDAIVQWEQVVRTDPLDPTGWLALARAEIAADRGPKARSRLDHVLETEWEKRFGDVGKEARALLQALDG